jgi:hypothetical protein
MRQSLSLSLVLTAAMLPLQMASSKGETSGSICIGWFHKDSPPERMGDPALVCAPTSKLRYRIDDLDVTEWPQKESVRVNGVSLQEKHRIRIYCGTKQQQTVTFRFSEFKSTKLCLSLNDLYWTAQLEDDKHQRWCRCKE